MRPEVNLLTRCPCNNISIGSASKQIKTALTGACIGPSNPFFNKEELNITKRDVPVL